MIVGIDHVQVAAPEGGEPDADGYPVHWDGEISGTARLYTEDPFGNRLELLATVPAAT